MHEHRERMEVTEQGKRKTQKSNLTRLWIVAIQHELQLCSYIVVHLKNWSSKLTEKKRLSHVLIIFILKD